VCCFGFDFVGGTVRLIPGTAFDALRPFLLSSAMISNLPKVHTVCTSLISVHHVSFSPHNTRK